MQCKKCNTSQSLLCYLNFLQDQDRDYVGFATLPNQVHRKTLKKGFTFTLMVAGECSCGSASSGTAAMSTDVFNILKHIQALHY